MVKTAIRLAEEAKKKAIAQKTFVGCCIVTTNNTFITGANLENSFKKTYHAEEVALIRGLMMGFRGTDFSYIVQLAFSEDRVYPCCLSCFAFLWDYTHPEFRVLVSYKGKIVYEKTLRELVKGFGGEEHVFPQKWRLWKNEKGN